MSIYRYYNNWKREVTIFFTLRNQKQLMQLVSRAADSFCVGDLVDRTIRNKNAWNLLPTQAMFASVIPGTIIILCLNVV